MNSSWGSSWGAAWGNAWGDVLDLPTRIAAMHFTFARRSAVAAVTKRTATVSVKQRRATFTMES